MTLLGEHAGTRRLIGIPQNAKRWRLRCRLHDIARLYLQYPDRIEERTVEAYDDDTMFPGDLIKLTMFTEEEGPSTCDYTNFWKIEKRAK